MSRTGGPFGSVRAEVPRRSRRGQPKSADNVGAARRGGVVAWSWVDAGGGDVAGVALTARGFRRLEAFQSDGGVESVRRRGMVPCAQCMKGVFGDDVGWATGIGARVG